MAAQLDQLDWATRLLQLGVSGARLDTWAPLFAKHVQPDAFNMGTEEMDDFVAQVLHESALLSRLEEDLNYSAQRLTEVWPERFPGLAAAMPYAFNPQWLAEKVYGGRMGNLHVGDAWAYRGSGLIMVTGHDNFALVQGITSIPIVSKPDILRTPEPALVVSKAWWDRKIPDAAVGNVTRITRIVNGGLTGLADRERLTNQAKEADA